MKLFLLFIVLTAFLVPGCAVMAPPPVIEPPIIVEPVPEEPSLDDIFEEDPDILPPRIPK